MPTLAHATSFLQSRAVRNCCERTPPAYLTPVQLRVSPARIAARSIRIQVSSALRVAIRTAGRSVRQLGISMRSISEGWRLNLQRRVAASICCRARIQSNMIAHDLEHQFPSARIERDVQVETLVNMKGTTKPGAPAARTAAPVDFIVFDLKGPKLIFETCAELERPQDHSLPRGSVTEPQHVVLHAELGLVHLDVSQAEKIQVCLRFETGQISYRKLIKWPAQDEL
jgi:hypothetical protein